MKTVTSVALLGAAELIGNYDVDPLTVARLAGIDAPALTDPDVMLDAARVVRFFDIAATACRDRCFGIELAHRQGLEILGSVWLLARSASTVGEALSNIGEAMQLYSNAIVLRSIEEDHGVAFCYDAVIGDAAGEAQVIELGYGLLCQEIRIHAGSKWMPVCVQFRHAAPTSLKRHRQEFGGSLLFNQDRNALLVDHSTVKLPLQTSSRLHGAIKRELRLRQRTSRESFPSRVDRVIRNLISSEICDAEVVAEALGMSVRTLQHKLAECGTSYQNILDSVRETLAGKYLRESDLSIAEIAELLQFSETSAFSRFFSKRRGVSPREFRKQCAGISEQQ